MRLSLFIGTILLSAAGTIWAAHKCLWGLSLNLETKPIEIATLAVNVIIAVLIQYYFASRITDRRAEKDILIDITNEAIATLKSSRETLASCYDLERITSKDRRTLLSQIRRLSNNLEGIESALEMSECRKLGSLIPETRAAYMNYKKAATGRNFPSKPFTYIDITDQERAFRTLNRSLQVLAFRINQYR